MPPPPPPNMGASLQSFVPPPSPPWRDSAVVGLSSTAIVCRHPLIAWPSTAIGSPHAPPPHPHVDTGMCSSAEVTTADTRANTLGGASVAWVLIHQARNKKNSKGPFRKDCQNKFQNFQNFEVLVCHRLVGPPVPSTPGDRRLRDDSAPSVTQPPSVVLLCTSTGIKEPRPHGTTTLHRCSPRCRCRTGAYCRRPGSLQGL